MTLPASGESRGAQGAQRGHYVAMSAADPDALTGAALIDGIGADLIAAHHDAAASVAASGHVSGCKASANTLLLAATATSWNAATTPQCYSDCNTAASATVIHPAPAHTMARRREGAQCCVAFVCHRITPRRICSPTCCAPLSQPTHPPPPPIRCRHHNLPLPRPAVAAAGGADGRSGRGRRPRGRTPRQRTLEGATAARRVLPVG